MRLTKAKEFTYNNIPCLKIGDVEESRTSFEKFRDEGKNWILTRTCAYMFRFVPDEDREHGIVKYSKIPTVTRCNLNFGSHKFMTWDEIRDYIAHDFKVWRVTFESTEYCLEEEYIARHDGDFNTYPMGKELFVESVSENSDFRLKQWYGEKATLIFKDPKDIEKMFHAWG